MANKVTAHIQGFLETLSHLPTFETVEALASSEFDPTQMLHAKPVIEALKGAGRYLAQFTDEQYAALFDHTPTSIQNEINGAISEMRSVMSQIPEVTKKQAGSMVPPRKDQRTFHNWAEQIEAALGRVWERVEPLKAQLMVHKWENTVDEKAALLRAATADVDERMSRLSTVGQVASTEALTRENISDIEDVIKEHERLAKQWLRAFRWLAGATFALIVGMVWLSLDIPNEVSTGRVIALAIGKLLVVSFALGLCVTASRNYQTHAHNLVVNRHRRVAWISFRDLYNSVDSGDQTSRTELVRTAAQAIFNHTSTGFLHKGVNEFTPLAAIAGEVIKRGKE